MGEVASLADVEQKLRTWLVRYYQSSPHAGLLGRDPATCFAEGEKVHVTEQELRDALTVRQRRRVRRDSTLSLGGTVYEVPLGYLAGQVVNVATSLFDGAEPGPELPVVQARAPPSPVLVIVRGGVAPREARWPHRRAGAFFERPGQEEMALLRRGSKKDPTEQTGLDQAELEPVDRMRKKPGRVPLFTLLWVSMSAIACSAPGGADVEPGRDGTEGPDMAIRAMLANDPLLVQALNGAVRGVAPRDVEQFLGIPYAAPPEGERRFAPPTAPMPWQGERDASQFGSVCPQLSLTGFVGNEDCLSLNVYRPAHHDPAKLLPVMIWIHGGSFTLGAGSVYDPRRLVEANDIVVVTVNYRLGPLGFLALPELSAEAGDGLSGDYGLMDQRAAFAWVRDNIAAFGGDPQQLTIQGESAGGVSVCAQLASPSAAGLFSRAIIQSGSCASVPVALAQTQGTKVANVAARLATDIAACADPARLLECLRALPAQQLVTASATAAAIYGPVVGGQFLPSAPARVVETGTQHPAPVLIGGLRDEMLNFAAAPPFSYRSLAATDYPAVLSFWIPNIPPDEILARYPLSSYPEPYFALSAALSDSGNFYGQALGGCVTATLADELSVSTTTYAYELDDPEFLWAPFTSFVPQGATHASDLAYLFETTPALSEPFNDAQRALAEQMVRAWGAFIRGGDPGTPSLAWPPYDTVDRRMLDVEPGKVSVTADFRARHNCDFWR